MSLPFHDSEIPIFLAGEPEWRSRLGEGWQGTKFLGKGGHGVVGLWEYKGNSKNPPGVKQVVVKMSDCNPDLFTEKDTFPKTKMDEGITLRKLAQLGSKHIVRQYGGNRLGDQFNDMENIVRIFLEYCPGKDCDRFLAPFGTPAKSPLAEVDLWALFHCMALGATVMARGTEDIKLPSWGGVPKDTELVHFDIKTDNIFLGYRDDNHRRMPIAKIGDLGEAFEVKAAHNQNDEYGALGSRRGMVYYQPPEETLWDPQNPFNVRKMPVQNPRKGTCSNIWQIGAVMNQLLLRRQVRFDDGAAADQCRTTMFSPGRPILMEHPNHSLDLETPEIKGLYSMALITLVMECLLRPPLHRPSSVELVQRTANGLQAALFAATKRKDSLPIPDGISSIPMMREDEPEPPTAWDVDDTIYEELSPPKTPKRRFGIPGYLTGDSRSGSVSSGTLSPGSSIFDTASRYLLSPSSPATSRSRVSSIVTSYGSIRSIATTLSSMSMPSLKGSRTPQTQGQDEDFVMVDESTETADDQGKDNPPEGWDMLSLPAPRPGPVMPVRRQRAGSRLNETTPSRTSIHRNRRVRSPRAPKAESSPGAGRQP